MNRSEKGFNPKLTSTFVTAVTLIAVSTSQLSPIVLFNGDVVYGYYNSQSQSNANDCGLDQTTGINCANNGPLMQGNGLASSPVIAQSAGQDQQGPQGPPGPPGPDKKIQTRIVESDVRIIPPDPNFSLITATCASDEVATGGGYSVQEQLGVHDNLINYQVIEPDPGQLANAWELRIQNPGPETIEVVTFAVCAKLADA